MYTLEIPNATFHQKSPLKRRLIFSSKNWLSNWWAFIEIYLQSPTGILPDTHPVDSRKRINRELNPKPNHMMNQILINSTLGILLPTTALMNNNDQTQKIYVIPPTPYRLRCTPTYTTTRDYHEGLYYLQHPDQFSTWNQNLSNSFRTSRNNMCTSHKY